MSQSIFLFLCALYFFGYIKECDNHYYNHYTNNRMRFMMYAMDRELIKDSIVKIKSVQFMRSLYARSPSYHVAERVFNIRRVFSRMVREYTMAHDMLKKISYWTFRTKEFQRYMITLQKIGMHLDHLVEALTEWESNAGKNLVNVSGFLLPEEDLRGGAGGYLFQHFVFGPSAQSGGARGSFDAAGKKDVSGAGEVPGDGGIPEAGAMPDAIPGMVPEAGVVPEAGLVPGAGVMPGVGAVPGADAVPGAGLPAEAGVAPGFGMATRGADIARRAGMAPGATRTPTAGSAPASLTPKSFAPWPSDWGQRAPGKIKVARDRMFGWF